MAGLFVTEGLDDAVKVVLGKNSLPTLKLHLFTNNHTVVNGDTLATFTECTLSGYAAVTLTAANWTGSTTGGVATYTYPTVSWTFAAYAGGVTIYGYYLEDTVNGKLYAAETFASSYAVPAAGGGLNLALAIEGDNT